MNRNELKECLAEDRKRILGNTQAYHVFFIVATRHSAWLRWKYVKNMRNAAFYQERFQAGNKLSGFPMMWYLRRKNLIGNKLGFEIGGGYSLNRKRIRHIPQRACGYSRKIKNRRELLTAW